MQVEVLKSELAGALNALGKLVCRTSPVEVYRSLQIEGKENKIELQTVSPNETFTYTLSVEGVKEFRAVVNFDEFRTVSRYSRNKTVLFEYEPGRFGVEHCMMRTFEVEWPEERQEMGTCEVSELPASFVNCLSMLAPIVDRNNYRPVLRGIHFCRDGMVVTNGKELLHIDIPLTVENLTIPFPHALLATKSEEAGRVVTWCDREYRYFRFEFGCWKWTGRALVGTYPNWRRVIPEQDKLSHIVSFDADQAKHLTTFLKGVPDTQPNNPITLSMGTGATLLVTSEGEKRINIPAEFPTDWSDFSITINKDLLLRLLNEGHTHLAFGMAQDPFIATQGIGKYVAMPLASHTQPVVQDQPQTKEEQTMNEPISTVAPPMQPVANNITPEVPINPLDDLATAVDEFKTRIRAMFDESTVLSRKVKEVALVQKQKEREFIQARRAIERIRMAI